MVLALCVNVYAQSRDIVFNEEFSHQLSLFDALPSVEVYNYTGKSNVELQKNKQKIITQINSMQSMVAVELKSVANNDQANPKRLLVTVEVVAIDDEFTYIYVN